MLETSTKKPRHTFPLSDAFLAIAVIFILLLLLIPINGLTLDVLITLNIVISLTTLLMTLYAADALSFNSFPSFLLFLTLFRLGLYIATTRMILTEAHAGEIIQTFGEVVTGGSQFVGFLIFILLTGVNFVVITKGSGRVAEVAARFALDSLPGKQLSIDADINAGLIDEEEAKHRRDKLIREADFYGAMDGASKFVRGDAIAGLVITLVNIVGGFIVGMLLKGMSWDQVVKVYMTLTVGDGLVVQIPALLVSVGAGIIVTRASSRENLSEVFRKQLFNNPRVLFITALVIFLLSLIPGMPIYVMAPVAFILYLYGSYLSRQATEANSTDEWQQLGKQEIGNTLQVDLMEIELGREWTPLSEELAQKVTVIRRQIADELGLLIPFIPIYNPDEMTQKSYAIKIKGSEIVNGQVDVVSEETLKKLAEQLTGVIRAHAHELLNRQQVGKLIENARKYASEVISELIPHKLSLGLIQKVLQNLLREGISIQDLVTILEILSDNSSMTQDPDVLSEYVRQGLARTITKQHLSPDKSIYAITLDSKVEQSLLESIHKNELGKHLVIHPITTYKIINEANHFIQEAAKNGLKPVFLTTAALRPYFKKLIERQLTVWPVLSLYEIAPEVQVYQLGVISSDVLSQTKTQLV